MYDNLFFDNTGAGDAIWITTHNDVPKAIDVFNNTIVASDFGIGVWGVDTNFTQRVVGNAVFAPTALDADGAVVTAANVTDTFANAGLYLTNPTGTPGSQSDPLDLYPLTGQLTGSPINTTPFQAYTAWNEDFNYAQHDGTFRGAYAAEGVNAGWLPALERKPLSVFVPTDFIYLPLILRP